MILSIAPQNLCLLPAEFSADPSAAAENFGRFIGGHAIMFRATHRSAETP